MIHKKINKNNNENNENFIADALLYQVNKLVNNFTAKGLGDLSAMIFSNLPFLIIAKRTLIS